MSIIDDAIVKLQTHALALTTVDIKGAPSQPLESASKLPLSIVHIVEGTAQADDATTTRMLLTVNMDIHFNRNILKLTYENINKVVPELLKRLGGDPTLGSTVDTIVYPIQVSVAPAQWDQVLTQMVTFRITLKYREDSTVT